MAKSPGKPKPSARKLASVKSAKSGKESGKKKEEGENNSSDLDPISRTFEQWPGRNVEDWDVDQIHPDPRNPNKHSNAQVELLGRIMDRWGWTSPVLVRESGMLIAGEGRWLAAKKRGFEKIPTMVARGWTEDEILAFIIADNEIARMSKVDKGILAADVAELTEADFDVDLLGLEDEDLAALKPREERYRKDPDEVPETQAETVCQRGDIWILGSHKLVCGDSTSGDVLERFMRDEKADAVWTDPPETAPAEDGEDDLPDESYAAFLVDAFVGAFQFMKAGAAIYIAHAEEHGLDTRAAFKSAGFKFSECIIWNKASIARKRRDYQPGHLPILYGWKTGAKHRWYGDRRQSSIRELEGANFAINGDGSIVVRAGDDRMILKGDNLVAEPIEPTVLTVERARSKKFHPAVRPVELVEKTLRNSIRKGNIVLDVFAGSGTTAIAAELNGWRARLVEIDPAYCDVIIRRWQEMTGRDAKRAEDEATFDQVQAGEG